MSRLDVVEFIDLRVRHCNGLPGHSLAYIELQELDSIEPLSPSLCNYHAKLWACWLERPDVGISGLGDLIDTYCHVVCGRED